MKKKGLKSHPGEAPSGQETRSSDVPWEFLGRELGWSQRIDLERMQHLPLRSPRGPAQDALGHRGRCTQPSWEGLLCPQLKDGLVVDDRG